ncbi:MAG: ABC transporter permease [Phycisphaerae bacterium]|nr:ABC transporter permease [Phycisphaerae bacterium]
MAVRSPWRSVLLRPRLAIGLAVIAFMVVASFASLPYLLGSAADDPTPRYNAGRVEQARTPPSWGSSQAGSHAASMLMGSDGLGRSLLHRSLVGGAISLTVGLCAAAASVVIGVAYGAIAGLAGGRLDGVMMRAVDVLYGLPYILIVVLLAVAIDAVVERSTVARVNRIAQAREAHVDSAVRALPPERRADPRARLELEREAMLLMGTGELPSSAREIINIATLLLAIGSVSWLTMARVARGEVIALKAMPFVEAARAIGVSRAGILFRHILPNLTGVVIVYATLAVPQAILQESFLSFLGIGVRPPLPSWGNLAAEGLSEINPYKSHWWLIAFPCALLAVTLVSLNLVGDSLRDALDPKWRGRRP